MIGNQVWRASWMPVFLCGVLWVIVGCSSDDSSSGQIEAPTTVTPGGSAMPGPGTAVQQPVAGGNAPVAAPAPTQPAAPASSSGGDPAPVGGPDVPAQPTPVAMTTPPADVGTPGAPVPTPPGEPATPVEPPADPPAQPPTPRGGETCLQAGNGNYSEPGPYKVGSMDVDLGMIQASQNSGMFTIFYPEPLEADCPHPIVAWGNGTTVTGSAVYAFFNSNAASWGMVVAASHEDRKSVV